MAITVGCHRVHKAHPLNCVHLLSGMSPERSSSRNSAGLLWGTFQEVRVGRTTGAIVTAELNLELRLAVPSTHTTSPCQKQNVHGPSKVLSLNPRVTVGGGPVGGGGDMRTGPS